MFIGVVGLGLAITWAVGDRGQTAAVGDAAPDFTVELLDGGSFSLDDHLATDGRPLVINLWASWCAPCREEIPDLSAFALAHPDIAVIGVAVEDQPDDSRALADELGPSYPLALGNTEFEEAYPNFGLPVTFFLNGDGTVTGVHNGVLTDEILTEMIS